MRTLDSFGEWVGEGEHRAGIAVLIVTTEDEQPDAPSTACLDWLCLKRHDATTLQGLRFAVLGLGDSSFLASAYRGISWATARDCNRAAQAVDAWLEQRGGERLVTRGESDERTGSEEIGPWIEGLLPVIEQSRAEIASASRSGGDE